MLYTKRSSHKTRCFGDRKWTFSFVLFYAFESEHGMLSLSVCTRQIAAKFRNVNYDFDMASHIVVLPRGIIFVFLSSCISFSNFGKSKRINAILIFFFIAVFLCGLPPIICCCVLCTQTMHTQHTFSTHWLKSKYWTPHRFVDFERFFVLLIFKPKFGFSMFLHFLISITVFLRFFGVICSLFLS